VICGLNLWLYVAVAAFMSCMILPCFGAYFSMEFGVDGMLYVTTGDAGARQKEYQWALDRSNLHGNIIRITDSGDIPADNPYQGEGTARCNERGKIDDGMICQEIYAYGLRNPFRFVMDLHSPDKVRYLISDVGGKTWYVYNAARNYLFCPGYSSFSL